ncbi:alpha/beta hydrolase [Nocardioides salsibiostraticola]
MSVDPGIAVLLDLIANSGYPPIHEATVEEARAGFRAMTCDGVTPDQVVAVGSVEKADADGVPARIYRPTGEGPFPTMVYIHGGGFVIGDLDTHDQTCRRICAGADTVVVSIDYRLAPEHLFPAAVEDTLTAVDWAAANLATLGGNDVLAVGGDSAGGNLSAYAAQARPDTVTAQVLIYPATHVVGDYASRAENATGYFLESATMEWFFTKYLGDNADVDLNEARLSPIFGELAGVGRAIVVTAQYDPLRDEGEAYADTLEAAGVEVDRTRYDAMIHGFIDMGPLSPAAAEATDDLVRRISALLHR